jgi:hypothetical protein
MPVRYPDAAGKPYMPSNGTEGEMFMSQWCSTCVKQDTCMRVLHAMAGDQPRDWRFDDNGEPECRAHSDKRPARQVPRCKKTGDLFA